MIHKIVKNLVEALGVETKATIAAAGSNQSGATKLTGILNKVTGADGSKGVLLPETGVLCVVHNSDTSGDLKVYPSTGCKINGDATNASITMQEDTPAIFLRMSETVWLALYKEVAYA